MNLSELGYYTMLNAERINSIKLCVKHIVNDAVPGAFVDCGVNKGGSSMLMAILLDHYRQTHRKIYMYDTFTGMPKPGKFDRKGKGEFTGYSKNWCQCPLPEVKQNMALTEYPSQNIVYAEGLIEDTVHKIIPEEIALLHLDMDFYSPTKAGLINLMPLISKGGYLVIDDYGCWKGCRKAVNEVLGDDIEFTYKPDYSQRILKI